MRLAPEVKENSGPGEMPLTVSHASRAATGQRSSFVLGRKMFAPSLNGSVLLWRKRILIQRGFSRLSTRRSSIDKPVELGSSNGALLEQISPDRMKPKKHVRNAAHNIILSLVSGRGPRCSLSCTGLMARSVASGVSGCEIPLAEAILLYSGVVRRTVGAIVLLWRGTLLLN